MRKPNKKLQEFRQRKAEERNARKRARKQIRQERLNHRVNVIEAKKQELFDRWVAAVNQHFRESDGSQEGQTG